jgi:arylsulfatase
LGAISLVVTLAPVGLWIAAAFPKSAPHQALATGRAAKDARPNLILISIDALRADFLGAYGNRGGLTPALDAFTREATQYDSAWAYSPWTLTSLGSLFTQLPPSWCGLKQLPDSDEPWYAVYAALPEDRPLLSERLHGVGYATGTVLTNVFLQRERGWGRGFDSYWNAMHGPQETTHAEELTRAVQDWMALNRREPFFLWAHYFDPHKYDAPTTPTEVRAKYGQWHMRSRKLWEGRMKHEAPRMKARYEEYCRTMYTEEVKYVDHWAGELLADLKTSGLWDRSLIVVTADHGEELFDHGDFEHGHSMHREVLRVPLLVKWPKGVTADRRIPQTVGLPSLGATFLQSAGLPAGSGREARPLPRQAGLKGDEVYSEAMLYGEEQTALTTDEWRVIYRPFNKSPKARFEVYDRRKDPLEKTNLAPAGAVKYLQARLRRLSEEAQREVVARAKREQGRERRVLTKDAERQLKSLGYME